jgi:hypothetical protein
VSCPPSSVQTDARSPLDRTPGTAGLTAGGLGGLGCTHGRVTGVAVGVTGVEVGVIGVDVGVAGTLDALGGAGRSLPHAETTVSTPTVSIAANTGRVRTSQPCRLTMSPRTSVSVFARVRRGRDASRFRGG